MFQFPRSTPAAKQPRTPRTASRLGRFGLLPELAGNSFLPIGFIARLPLAMLTVGALTLVTSASGSYALGGFAAGAVGVGSAIGAPVFGFLADRLGQRMVLLTTSVLNTLAILTVLIFGASVTATTGGPAVLAAAFAMGLTSPQIGPMARVRWVALTQGRRADDLDTALSYESTADELTFVLGPALVGLLASLVAPWLPLALAAVLTIAMVTAFALHRTGRAVVPTSGRRRTHASAPRRSFVLIAVPVLGMVAMGTFFGSTQTALTAFAGQFDAAEAAGLLYAVMGLSSAAAALSVAYWPRAFGHPWRWVLSAAAMAALSGLFFLPGTIPPMLLVLFLLGIPVGPTMVTIFSIGSAVAPPHLLGTVMTLLASGIVAGTAIGSAASGSLADTAGPTAAFLVSVAAAGALLLLGLASVLGLRTKTASPAAG